MAFKWLYGGDLSQKRQVIQEEDQQCRRVVDACFCANGHSLLTETRKFQGLAALTLKLYSKTGQGLLLLSPVIGDRDREFIGIEQVPGEIVEICCPECEIPFPIYNECSCGAHLVALFTSPQTHFAQCIGLCQRIGCLHSELLTERDLRLFNRQNYF